MLDHGFDDKSVGAGWWNQRLASLGLPQRFGPGEQAEQRRLTRRDLFQLAGPAAQNGASDDDVLMFLWHALAWGTGSSQRGNDARVRAFADPTDRQRNIALLKQAMAFARAGDPAAAYRVLIRRGGGKIRGLGPAFFTKLLYFASEGAPGTRCLILDARVAGNLAEAGWSSLPRSNRTSYSYNWYTATYASYCELLKRWANEESERLSAHVWPDEIERALFQGHPNA
ncbi:hypothetical protein [Terrabacter sp. NPDC080008]|uniref:8-oxoguanine DNA glycosylase OGG fold protein n=1 Tax=Terrabacter sp. NPDC080008 TaxID=3155176 RepID=UPI0034507401